MTDSTLPRKILMTADAVGGVWTYALDLARGLAPEGVQFTIATMGPRPTPAQKRDAGHLPNVSLVESDYRLEWMEEPWNDVDAAGEWLGQLAADLAPDLIHLNGYAHAARHWPAPVLVAAHSCVLSWWRAVRGMRNPEEWNEYRRRVARGLQAADFVVAPTRAMLATLGDNYGDLPRLGVIPNGRDARKFRAARKEPFVFSAGRFWDESKNLSALEKAAGRISWPVRVAGSDEEHNALVSLGKLSPDAVADELSRATIFCLPARYEPFGLSALEAAFSGCALVLGGIASLREVWEDAALFVDPDDSTALAGALQQLISDPERQRQLAQRAQRQAQRYGLQAMAERYLSLYRGLTRQAQLVKEAA
ncbi:MAG TPA: glycosyltransferase family 4 protein [Chthoniobacterales bacterium]|nr:glycosyltransferase family 4 protein [Chthoniobacterales bacterium]